MTYNFIQHVFRHCSIGPFYTGLYTLHTIIIHISMERRCLVYENITSYLKNHWTIHRHVCIHFDAFSILIPNMDTKCYNSEIFQNFLKINWRCRLYSDSLIDSWSRLIPIWCSKADSIIHTGYCSEKTWTITQEYLPHLLNFEWIMSSSLKGPFHDPQLKISQK